MRNDLFYELVKGIDGYFDYASKEPQLILLALRERLGVDHVAYLGVNLPGPMPTERKDAFIVTSYSDKWVARYVCQNYVRIDPVIQSGLRGIVPIDWADLPARSEKKVRQFFGEAGEHGVGAEGLSIPIRGVHGETAMFSVNTSMRRNDWLSFRKKIIRDLQIVAYHFHTRVLDLNGAETSRDISLSERERECLKWAAAGKSAWETGEILGIREGTVNFFLEQCRVKLDSTNKVQAVAKAVRLSLI